VSEVTVGIRGTVPLLDGAQPSMAGAEHLLEMRGGHYSITGSPGMTRRRLLDTGSPWDGIDDEAESMIRSSAVNTGPPVVRFRMPMAHDKNFGNAFSLHNAASPPHDEPVTVDELMDSGQQATAGAAYGVVSRLEARIRVIRSSPVWR
jgi:hypothetical protein